MSCGGHILSGFTCGARRFDKYKFTAPDKPSNPALHQENQAKLNDLLRLREEQDKGIFQSLPTTFSPTTFSPTTVSFTGAIQLSNTNSITYYPTSDVSYKSKQD